MPVKSKAQMRYMGAVASGSIKARGLSPEKAKEFLSESRGTYGKLPNKVNMKDKNMDDDAENGTVKGGMGKGKFGKDTYAKGKKGAPKKKGKKMSRAEFLKMVREKKYKKK